MRLFKLDPSAAVWLGHGQTWWTFWSFQCSLALASHIFSLGKCPKGSAGLCRKRWPTVFMFMSCNFIWGVPFISQTESTAEQARWCVHSFLKNYKIWGNLGPYWSIFKLLNSPLCTHNFQRLHHHGLRWVPQSFWTLLTLGQILGLFEKGRERISALGTFKDILVKQNSSCV